MLLPLPGLLPASLAITWKDHTTQLRGRTKLRWENGECLVRGLQCSKYPVGVCSCFVLFSLR